MADPIFGAAWPATAASAQQKVDNAYMIWRSSGADDVEKALNTLNSQGGSAAAYFTSQSRELFDKWDLSLSGVVPVRTPYTQITPASWYDHTNNDIGFTGLKSSSTDYHANGGSQRSSYANNWYKGSASSTEAQASASFFGISLGGSGGSSSSHSSSAGHEGGQESSHFADATTAASIELEYGIIDIERPWLLTELFHIGGWYVPGEPAGCVSDGTIAGQEGDDKKLLPMIKKQALVIRNVKITASGWGSAGSAMSSYYQNQQSQSDSSSWNVAGSVGFLGIGGSAGHSESEWAGSSSTDSGASWSFEYDSWSDSGTLTIDGCQIVGYVGEIVGLTPRLDGGKPDKDALPGNGDTAAANGDGAAAGNGAADAGTPAAANGNGDGAATPTTTTPAAAGGNG